MSSLTVFMLPKAFEGLFDILQRNAIESWLQVYPKPTLILFGDEAGTAEVAKEYGLMHRPHIARNDLGTPLVNDLFVQATALSDSPFYCFVNADIVVDPRVAQLVDTVTHQQTRVLLVSRRWDVEVNTRIDWAHPNAEAGLETLQAKAKAQGALYPPVGMDLFVFPKGFFDAMPPFSIGWPGAKYDNWMVYYARKKRLSVVDVTLAMTTLHQNHPTGFAHNPAKQKEHLINLKLAGGYGHCYDSMDATYFMDEEWGLHRRISLRARWRVWIKRWLQRVIDPIRLPLRKA
ncbi:MAG: hypothetical protein AB7F28_08280 [Candidatus Margulisiibacteriota bacterium]